MSMSISLPLLDTKNNTPPRLDNPLYAANGSINTAAMNKLISNQTQPLSSVVPMLGQQFDGELPDATNTMAGLPGFAAQPGDDASTAKSSPSDSSNLASDSPITNYSISPTELDRQDTTEAKPRTRSSAGSSNSKQRQTKSQTQTQTQTQTSKQKQQPAAAAKSKKSPAKSKAGAGVRKSQPRNRSLERNRIAASKCRQKKKEWLSDLEANKTRLERQYKSLHSELNELVDEVAKLKNFVMTHARCNDPNIDGWINNEANSYIRKLNHNMAPQAGQLGAPAQGQENMFKNANGFTPDSRPSESITPPGNHGYSNDYMLDGMFDNDPMLGQSMTVA